MTEQKADGQDKNAMVVEYAYALQMDEIAFTHGILILIDGMAPFKIYLGVNEKGELVHRFEKIEPPEGAGKVDVYLRSARKAKTTGIVKPNNGLIIPH